MKDVSSLLESVKAEMPRATAPAPAVSIRDLDTEIYDQPVPVGWKHLAMMRAKNPNTSLKELAKACGFSYHTLLVWTRKPEYQRYENWVVKKEIPELPVEVQQKREAAMDRVRAKFETHMGDMQDRLLTILETTENEGLAAKIAHDWLDRGGAPAQRVNQQNGVSVVITSETLLEFRRRALEAGFVIDGEVVGNPPA